MLQSSAMVRKAVNNSHLLLLATLLALVVRLPYWQTIPAAGDEVGQAIYAFRIAQGEGFPLVGNDAYAGPFFFYLLALLFRLGITAPLLGRAIVLITGTLTVTVTYAWVRRLGGGHVASLVAAALVATNPHLTLLNSHVGGTTFVMPFFTTVFLWFLSNAVDSDHYGWLVALAVAAGLGIQANPIAGLLVAGGWIWATFRVRRSPRLGKHWPLWPLVGALCVVLVYSPVIAHNITMDMDTLEVMKQRSYLWESSRGIQAFLSNEQRFILQLVRQVSGVLRGDETFKTLLWMPLLYIAWMVAGLIFTARKISLLPIAVTLPFFFILPCFSSHYGLIDPVRFTSLLTPVFAACMGFVFAAWVKRAIKPRKPGEHRMLAGWSLWQAKVHRVVSLVFGLVLVVYPLISLFQYYDFIEKEHLSGRALLDLSRQVVAANKGEPVYISDTDILGTTGIPYVPQAYLLFAGIHQEFLSPRQIIGRLFESPGPASLLISDEDADYIQQVAHLIPWPGTANEEARHLRYGLYTLDMDLPLIKPRFVLSGDSAHNVEPRVPVEILVGGGIELIGYDAPDSIKAGETQQLTFYWRAVGRLPHETYIGFVHLYDPETATLIAQDDHMLGREKYPFNAWQPDEVVVERYLLSVPHDTTAGQYALRAGVYTWPDLARLDVPDHPDDVIVLEPIHIES